MKERFKLLMAKKSELYQWVLHNIVFGPASGSGENMLARALQGKVFPTAETPATPS